MLSGFAIAVDPERTEIKKRDAEERDENMMDNEFQGLPPRSTAEAPDPLAMPPAVILEAREKQISNDEKVRPSVTEIRVAQNLLIPGTTQHHACRAAGYSDSYARTHSTEIVNRPGVQTALQEALERAMKDKNNGKGLKDGIAETLVTGMLTAEKKAKDGTMQTDYTERRKSAESVATFAGFRPATQVDLSPGESYHERILRLNADLGPDADDYDV